MSGRLAAALAVLLLPALPAVAQEATPLYGEVALQGGFLPDPWTRDLLAGGDRWAGEIDAACGGYVNSGPPDLALQFSQPRAALHLALLAETPVSLLVRLPNGAWQCSGATDSPARLIIGKPIPGSYEIWTGSESGFPDARLFISERLLPPEELRFQAAASAAEPAVAIGEPRLALVADATLLDGRVTSLDLLAGGEDEASLFADYCVGTLDAENPGLALTLTERAEQLSLYAQSQSDTGLVVRTPDGGWHCDDDSYGFNPAVTLWDVGPGELLAWVSVWGGGEAEATLHLRAGDPRWEASERLRSVASARGGSLALEPASSAPLSLALVAGGETVANEVAAGCVGHIDPDEADLFVEVAPGLGTLSLYATAAGDLTLVVVGPDGSLHCDDDSYELHPAVILDDPAPGRYAAWIGSWAEGRLPATVFAVAGEPQWEAALPDGGEGLEPEQEQALAADALLQVSESRGGLLTLDPAAAVPQQLALRAGGQRSAWEVAPGCGGNIDPAAADLFVELPEGLERVSLYATAAGDLTLLVLGPDGQIHCDDDSWDLHPAVTLDDPAPGRYAVWIGSWGEGTRAADFFAVAGEPQWEEAVPQLDLGGLSLLEALQASLAFHGQEEEFVYAEAEELADGSAVFTGLEVGPAEAAVSIERMVIREIDLEAMTAGRLPTALRFEIQGMDLSGHLPEAEEAALLFGGGPAILDVALDYRYDAAATRGAIERLTVGLPGQAEVTLALSVLGTPPDPEQVVSGLIGPEQLELLLERASLQLHDSGLLRRVLEMAATEERTTIEALVEVGLAELAKALDDLGIAEHPATRSLLAAVSSFARENQQPRRLSVALAPAQPLDAATLIGGALDPAALWDLLNLTADYAAE